MISTWLIKFYKTEEDYSTGLLSYSMKLKTDRNYAITLAKSIIQSKNYKYYDLQEIYY